MSLIGMMLASKDKRCFYIDFTISNKIVILVFARISACEKR